MTAVIQALAQQVLDRLEERTRSGEDTYLALASDAPEWMTELMHEAHGDFLPDDWRYIFIRDALEAITGHDDFDDARDHCVDDPEVYTRKLLDWVASSLCRVGYCDEALEDGSAPVTLVELLQVGRGRERGEVFDLVLSSLRKRADESDDEVSHE